MNRSRLRVAAAAAIAAAILVFGAVVVLEVASGSTGTNGRAGSSFSPQLPTFDLPSVHDDGTRQSSAEFAGKLLVINVFDYTCVPCITELPMLDRIASANPDVAFVGVHLMLQRAEAEKFVDRLGVRFPVVYDETGVFSTAVVALPTTVFVGTDGREVGRVTGTIAEADLTDRLERLREGIS